MRGGNAAGDTLDLRSWRGTLIFPDAWGTRG